MQVTPPQFCNSEYRSSTGDWGRTQAGKEQRHMNMGSTGEQHRAKHEADTQ